MTIPCIARSTSRFHRIVAASPPRLRSTRRSLLTVACALLLQGCYVVNSTVDAVDANPGDGKCERALTASEVASGLSVTNRCTLRAAVMEANTHIWKSTIIVPTGNYALDLPIASGGGSLWIAGSMKIQGQGAATTSVDQQTASSVVYVQQGNSVEINHVKLTGGDSQYGGGIWIDGGEVEIEDAVVQDNFGFTGGGGVLVNENAVAYIRRSTIAGNSAQGAFGGGILNLGELWVYDTTISGNESNRAGGIRNQGNMNLRNVTVSGNWVHSPSAGTGGISQSGFAVLNNVTITDNTGVGTDVNSFIGGGIKTAAGKTTVLKNSIVAGNDGGDGPDDCIGSLSGDSKYSLIGDTTGCVIPSYVSTFKLNVDAQLGGLASYHGPTRPQTHILFSASPARNAGYEYPPPAADACESRDEVGVPRPQGTGPCDMGAVEYSTASNLVTTGFMLVDAATDTDITALRHDDTVLQSMLPDQWAIRATVSGAPAKVVFGFDGQPEFHTENAAPFALSGDNAGDYAPANLAVGEHTLSATPFNGPGAAGAALEIKFTIID